MFELYVMRSTTLTCINCGHEQTIRDFELLEGDENGAAGLPWVCDRCGDAGIDPYECQG